MSNWRTVDELRNIFIEKYTNSKLSNELEKACSEEYELMRDYNGRQILELLQNVDDAYGDKKKSESLDSNEEVEVKITYKDNVLEVGNTGTTFTKETIERLCLGRASNKSSQNIGNKGTGFRSLLNDAEWIELYSGDFAIRFSEDFAKSCFDKYSHIELINEQLMSWKKDYPLCFPTMNCPEQIEMVVSDFDTLIRVKLKERNHLKETGITKQLKQPFYKSLLFLPYITKITINTDEETRMAEKLIDGMDVLIERTVDGTREPAEEYFVFKKDVKIDDKTAALSIAVPKDGNYDFRKEKLYCYFPIRNFSTPINALINAPFITNNSRDDVPNDSEEINKKIFGEVLPFIKDVAEELAKPEYADTAIKLVTPIQDNKLWDRDVFNFHDEYLGLLSDATILPTVNGEYISIQDEPKLLMNVFPTEFKGEEFNLLLQLSTEESVELVVLLSEFVDYDELDFSAEDLARKVNLIHDKWEISARIKVYLWWSNQYRDADIVPNLLMDSRDNWIQKSNKVFLPTDGGISVLPNELGWVKLCVLRQDYVDELIFQIKVYYGDEWMELNDKFSSERTGDKRLLDAFSEEYLAVEFTEQSSSDLIISTINRQIDNEDKAKSFINWFFDNYRDRLMQGSELSKVPFNLPSENGDIKSSNKLFLGKNYGNTLGDKLFANTTYSALMEPNKLYQGNDIDGFTDFIEKCGVAKFPLIENKSLTNNYEFKNFISDKYSNEIDFNINFLTTKSIQNIENLISNLKTSEIVEWVSYDEGLRELLYSNRKESNVTQQSNWNGVYFNSNEYIKYVLNTTPWIQFDGNKYSPQQVVKYDKLKANVQDLYGISEQDLLEVVGNDLILNLDFKDSMALLEDTDILRILDTLPTFDNGEISRKLYTEIIKFKRDKEPTYSAKNILVLAKDGKFYCANEVKYADKKLPKTLENQEHFISIPVKQNISTINKWLGVERYKTNLKLLSFIKVDYSIENFKQEIDEIKTAVLSTIDDNKTNVDKIKRMQIIPCCEIVAIDKEQSNRQIQLEDFYFVDAGMDFYIKLPSSKQSIEQLRLSDEFSNAIVDIFKQLLTLELDANLIELLVSKNSARKREKISDEFGVDKWSESYELLFSKNAISRLVFDYFSENGARGDTLIQIENIDFSYFLRDSDNETVISSLNEINKDISDLNILSELINIDVRVYWQKKIRQYLDDHQQEFEGKLFSKLISNGEIENQNRFLVELDEYKNYSADLDSIVNSVKFDWAQVVYKCFPILTDNIDKVDAKTIYKKNYDELNPDNLYTDEIANNRKVQIMIYFNRIDEFKSWLIIQQEKVDKEKSEKSIDVYKQLEGVFPEKQEMEFHESKGLLTNNKKRHGGGAYTKSAEEKANNAKKIFGNKGELLIYNLLCKQYGVENVFPMSEAFVEIGILKPGQASSGEYDLSYKDEHGKTFFVEVKTGDGKSFMITPGELEFAKQNPDQFILYLVSEIDSDKPKYHEVPPRFWEDNNFRLKEVVERIEVEF